jgi:hypothetical protein
MPSPIKGTLGIDYSRIDTERKHPLNMEVDFDDGRRRKYIYAHGAIAAWDALRIVPGHARPIVYEPTQGVGDPLEGVSEFAIPAGSYGWVKVKGWTSVNSVAGPVQGQSLAPSATAGHLDHVTAVANPPAAADFAYELVMSAGLPAFCTVAEGGTGYAGIQLG